MSTAATVALAVRSFVSFTKKHPISRGMITYTILWPSSNICQQLLQEREKIDWKEALRFSFFGCTYAAPMLYTWVKIVGKLVPGNSLRVAVTKAIVEQILYSPIAITGFYYGMSFLEGKNFTEATEEVKAKFLTTYKTGACVWPLVQTINFAFIHERNRVMFTGTISFFWAIYMSYMKQLEVKTDGSKVKIEGSKVEEKTEASVKKD